MQLIREVFLEIAFVVVVDTHLPRFETLAYVLPHFDELTHVVIRASPAFIIQAFVEVFYSVFVKRTYFKSLMKVLYLPVLAESFKTFIFEKFRRPLRHKVKI